MTIDSFHTLFSPSLLLHTNVCFDSFLGWGASATVIAKGA
jgi:hypothetical protein